MNLLIRFTETAVFFCGTDNDSYRNWVASAVLVKPFIGDRIIGKVMNGWIKDIEDVNYGNGNDLVKRDVCVLTWTKFEMSIGNIESGKRRMLKSDSETKAISGFNTLFSSTKTNTANVTRDTCDRFQVVVGRKVEGKKKKIDDDQVKGRGMIKNMPVNNCEKTKN